ncbi:erythromycin esterase family protein [Stackebrandtia nassauensis]|uniref:Erythromycin esterase n=1 Tax=Stackebrandtia nassauensis (strain DSM 44728 / CIP 108903 / NRRL B-16338 / NBRC 102104 / LLR-40K-21) TaxID=446470 RepID=D3PVV7_STANL|nr:erythromycin esterase family protein [Stackebrandtia nassauensis]ADD45078.1 Erythromycin esterase [Stackebrandtia nassauensis DSM 44728]
MSLIKVSRRGVLGLTVLAATGAAAAIAAPAWATTSSSEEVAEWIDRKARPLRTTDPGADLDDLRALRHVVDGATVAGLGEASHGSRELFRVKHRMTRFLVERMGFRTLAFEQDFAWGTLIDHYVVTGEGDPRELVSGMSSPLWATEEILELITWMRSYNEEHRDKVRFLGADLLTLHQLSFDKVIAYVEQVAPERLDEVQAELKPLRLRGEYYEHFQWYDGLDADEKQRLIEHARELVKLLEALPDTSDYMDGEFARQHARAILGWYEYYVSGEALRPNRERFIADAVRWWKRLHGGRIAYWAANVHTGAAKEVTFRMPGDTSNGSWAGHHLRQYFGRRYVSIGTAFHEGSITSGWAPPAPYRVDAPPKQLLEAVLGASVHADYLLDLRASAPRPVREWLAGPARLRMIHPSYTTPGDGSDHTMSVDSLTDLFDAIVHIRTTTPSRLLR